MPRIVPLHWRDLEQVFLRAGCRFARQEGGHRSHVKEGSPRPIVVPAHGMVPVSIIRNNLKTAGLSREEYFCRLESK